MPQMDEVVKIVRTYQIDFAPEGRMHAMVTSFRKKGAEIYVDIQDEHHIPFGIFSGMSRSRSTALRDLLTEILEEHPA